MILIFWPWSLLTLNSASAKLLPRHILGPSEKVRRWRCPEISLAGTSKSTSHRSGSNSFALDPQNASDKLIARIGEATIVPFLITILVTVFPVLVTTGELRGMTSSSVAYKEIDPSGKVKKRATRTIRTVSSTGGCSRSISWTTESRYGRLDVNCSHVGSVPENWESSSRSFCCFSRFLESSMSAHYPPY